MGAPVTGQQRLDNQREKTALDGDDDDDGDYDDDHDEARGRG